MPTYVRHATAAAAATRQKNTLTRDRDSMNKTKPKSTRRLRIDYQDHIYVVRLVDRQLLGEPLVSEVAKQLTELLADRMPRLVLRLDNCDHLGSAMVGKLVRLTQKATSKCGEVALAQVSPAASEVIRVCRLTRLFRIFPTARLAVETMTRER